jgi:hypothetical protein
MNKKLIAGALSFLFLITIVVIVLLFTGPRMKYQPSVRSFEREMPLPPEDIVSFNQKNFDFNTASFPSLTKENLKKGKVYYSYYCIFCHGEDGRGNGEVGKSYTPKPADLKKLSPLTDFEQLYSKSFKGTGHSPVLERVIPYNHRPYILEYIKDGL